jgi:hypothetical protein
MSDAIQFHSRVGADGVLNLQVNLGRTEAEKEVVVTIALISAGDKADDEALGSWSEFVARTYGSCAGHGLERQEQGSFEEREPIA